MNSINIFYGPKKGFDDLLKDNYVNQDNLTGFSTLVRKSDEARREYKHIVNVPTEEPPAKEPIYAENMVAYSDDYASVNEHVIVNFDGFVTEFNIDNMFLHNPPELIHKKITKLYSEISKITYYKYSIIDEKKIIQINNEYDKYIIGQPLVKDHLLKSLIPLTRENHKKPVVLVFYGPSGVGKTETAKYLARALGGNLFRKQLSMFQNTDFMTYLFGGHHYEKSFAKELLERETNVILLDEFDKPNPVFHSAFYQLFDEGVFEDKNYNLKIENSIIICTSNYKSLAQIREHLGDPIFSRFNACIKFDELSKEGIKRIIKLRLENEWDELDPKDKEKINKDEIEKLFDGFSDKIKNARNIESLVREIISAEILKRILSKDEHILPVN